MTKKVVLYPYSRRSKSARALSEVTGWPIVRAGDTELLHSADVVINWGSSNCPFLPNVLNAPDSISVAVDKRKAFRRFNETGVDHPPAFWDRASIYHEWDWARRHGAGVSMGAFFVRSTATGSGGRGVQVVQWNNMPEHPPENVALMTAWIESRAEYRVHVMGDKVIRTQEKRACRDDADPYIRNHANGYKFYLGGIAPDHRRDDVAVRAVRACGLDFGAVDIVHSRWDYYSVLEVNTAPGLSGESAPGLYADAFRSIYNLV